MVYAKPEANHNIANECHLKLQVRGNKAEVCHEFGIQFRREIKRVRRFKVEKKEKEKKTQTPINYRLTRTKIVGKLLIRSRLLDLKDPPPRCLRG